MDPLILKLLLTPSLVLLVALAQRRLGELIGGRLAALPLTSGPLVLVVVSGQGSAAGRVLVEGILTGVPAAVVFFVVYAALADRLCWWACLTMAAAASVLTGATLAWLQPPTWTVLTALTVCWLVSRVRRTTHRRMSDPVGRLEIGGPPDRANGPFARGLPDRATWDLLLRVGITTGCVVGLSAAAQVLPQRVAGVIAAFPALVCVVAGLTHRRDGAEAARRLVRGVRRGLPGTVAFFVVLVVTLGKVPWLVSFGLALVGSAGQYLGERVHAVVQVRLRDHQWRRHPQRRVVRFLAQHAEPYLRRT